MTKTSRHAAVEAELQEFYDTMFCLGSRDPSSDFRAVMNHSVIRNLAATEIYRLLMEPIFRFKEEGAEVAVTVFRPLRDMHVSDVYNWMMHFKCLDVDYDEFEDVAHVLDPKKHGYWHIFDSRMRGARLFLTPDKDRMFQDGCGSDEPTTLEYVTIPRSLLPADVVRTGYTSQTVSAKDLVIAWNFPEDPVRSWRR